MANRTSKIAIGAVIAAGVGYIAGILTAPKSGKETRKDIADAAIKVKSETERRLKQIYSELDDAIAEAKRRAAPVAASAKQELEKLLERASKAKDKVREVLSAIHEGETDNQELDKVVKDVDVTLNDLKAYLSSHDQKS